MVIEGLALIAGAALTAIVGAPIAARAATGQAFRGPAPLDVRNTNDYDWTPTPFEPIDMGPSNLHWPSEIDRPVTALPEKPWPSALWDDEHFGKFNTELAQQAAQRRSSSPSQKTPQTPQPHARGHGKQAKAAKKAANKAKQARQAQVKTRQQRQQPQKPRPQMQAARKAADNAAQQLRAKQAAAKQAATNMAGNVPSKEEIERLVLEIGLAGTVQQIMDRTGWDFRKAAHFLAKTRNG